MEIGEEVVKAEGSSQKVSSQVQRVSLYTTDVELNKIAPSMLSYTKCSLNLSNKLILLVFSSVVLLIVIRLISPWRQLISCRHETDSTQKRPAAHTLKNGHCPQSGTGAFYTARVTERRTLDPSVSQDNDNVPTSISVSNLMLY